MTTATFITAFLVSFLVVIASTEASAFCHVQPNFWLNDLQSTSSLYYSSTSPPLQVDGDFLDQTVAKLGSGHIAVLFHASWCPFSRKAFPIFQTISLMFSEIEHLTIEQASAMPSVLSRYGIHSFPAILILNHSSSVHYRGPWDLSSLVQFYKKTTGADPIQYMPTIHPMTLSNSERSDMPRSSDSSLKEMLIREPYLAFSILFIFLRLLHFLLPEALAFGKALWRRFVIPRINLEIFGETSQIFSQVLHMIDVKRFWTKLKVCKTRNFHQRTRNARFWASSLATVSVGEN
ncbi:hypothetical protein QQ045_025688 [Rhodiola kirilowii]